MITLPRCKISPNLAGWLGGNGPGLILIHGVGLTADAWYAMLPELTRHFTITAIDLPGHGESPPLASKASLSVNDYSDAIADLLSRNEGPSIIVGHSMGALISIDLAIRHPQYVAATVPLNAIFRRTDAAAVAVKKRASALSSVGPSNPAETLERWFGQSPEGALMTARENCERMLHSANAAGYAAAYNVFADSDGPADSELRSLETPMFCMTGSDETNSTPAMSEALAALAQDGQAVVIDGARHMMPITHANEVNRHIIEFAHSKGLLNA